MLNIICGRTSIVKVNCNKCSLLTTRNKKNSYTYIVRHPASLDFQSKQGSI